MRSLPTKPIQHHDPGLGLPFMFVTAVNMGPLAGAYTRPLLSSTCAVSDTRTHPKHPLNTP